MANTPNRNIDTARLALLLDKLNAFPPGAATRGHKDHDDREGVLDEMQQMLGLGMVMVSDIITKANAALGRASSPTKR